MEYTTIEFQIAKNIAQITLNRPQALNALNSEVFKDLNKSIRYY
jgi:enoyl-CoA hydratase/carnithine racemase